ncbi:nucleotidyltransferase domain-containing protein [Paenibacillus soyae]|uniref:Nucleotidyltransferase family protein n=1 Tax=Paenibacillus soyae TaxID=2969249 RepID=A0A9X2S8K3_9BACL|nr:nucleotidyltransferase family protein [Paenibacillus soyae]MCR2802508.1 nucleotidyltransferase family protein [Paenibacillus soyae]
MISDVSFHIGNFSQELRLLLAMLEMEEGSELTFEQWELLQEIDWHAFIELARHHRVFPTIHLKLQELKTPHIPLFVSGMFQRDYYRNTLQMLALSGEMEQLSSRFADKDIRALFLKGPVIAADLYGDVSLRTSCDLDLLVPMGQLETTEELLISLGYEKDDYISSVLNDWKWRHHHLTFHHPSKGIKVEVHWRLNPAPSKEPSFDELWSRKRKSSLISRPIYYLGREDLFLFLVSHGARHGWSRLRWLLDIKKLMNQRVDWPRLTHLLKKHHYHNIGGQALFLAARLLAAPLKEEMRPLLASRKAEWLAEDTLFYIQRMVNLHTPPLPKDVERYHRQYLFALMSKRQKLQYMASFLYPFPEDARTLPLPKRLHFLYFPLRPLLWAWRKTRRLPV